MAFSYCWRYKCLPNKFSTSNFTATVTELTRFNIDRMPGDIVYNAALKVSVCLRVRERILLSKDWSDLFLHPCLHMQKHKKLGKVAFS